MNLVDYGRQSRGQRKTLNLKTFNQVSLASSRQWRNAAQQSCSQMTCRRLPVTLCVRGRRSAEKQHHKGLVLIRRFDERTKASAEHTRIAAIRSGGAIVGEH